jgi:hypothetical protein
MKPLPDIEITGTATRFNLEGDSKGAVLVVYTEGEDGRIGRSWIRFDETATRALKSRAATLPDLPAEGTAPVEDIEAALGALPPGFNFVAGAPVIGGDVVLGDFHAVSGGVVQGDVYLGGRPSSQ